MNHRTEEHVLKSMGDSSLNIYILGNAISKAGWYFSTINTVELQRKREEKERNKLSFAWSGELMSSTRQSLLGVSSAVTARQGLGLNKA